MNLGEVWDELAQLSTVDDYDSHTSPIPSKYEVIREAVNTIITRRNRRLYEDLYEYTMRGK